MGRPRIIWTVQAKNTLNSIYKYYKEKSLQGAIQVRADLLKSPKSIQFAEQYQIDDINPKYRRIVVRDFKVLYKEVKQVIYVMDIINTWQSPEVLKNK